MDTNCLKQLLLLEFALLHESGSRKAAGAVVWFSETTHIALAVPAKLKGVCTLYHFDYLLFDKRVEQLLGILLCNILHI